MLIGTRECVTSIDVSNHQASIDWAAVRAAGISFAHAKATEGVHFTDKWYARNRDGATANGLHFGAYHYLRGTSSGAEQARFFLDVTDNLAGCTMPPQIDVEQANDGLTARHVLDFAHAVEAATGVRPIVYLGAWFGIDRPAELAAYDLWLPAYPSNRIDPDPTSLKLPKVSGPWATWEVWQYAGGTGRCPGVNGGCDRNVATVEWFNRVTGKTAPAAPIPIIPQEDDDPMRTSIHTGTIVENGEEKHLKIAIEEGGIVGKSLSPEVYEWLKFCGVVDHPEPLSAAVTEFYLRGER